MKQTAVEWLIKKLHSHSGHIDILDVANINNYFDQAKEMEKQQIKKAFNEGHSLASEITSEQYYNETFKQ